VWCVCLLCVVLMCCLFVCCALLLCVVYLLCVSLVVYCSLHSLIVLVVLVKLRVTCYLWYAYERDLGVNEASIKEIEMCGYGGRLKCFVCEK
jgi:hypothetical protein